MYLCVVNFGAVKIFFFALDIFLHEMSHCDEDTQNVMIIAVVHN